MSTSLLYRTFGIRGYQYVATRYEKGRTVFVVKQVRERLCCPECRSRNVLRRGQSVREFRTVPIGNKPVFVRLAVQRVECRSCGVIRQVQVTFAQRRRSYTRAFERYALDLSRHMTIKDVAAHLGVSWDVIKDIQKRYLVRCFAKPKLRKLKRIGIDEICIGRGRRYVTVVLDLDSGAVVFVGENHDAAALDPFWRSVKAAHAKLEAVAVDMWPAYSLAIRTHIPDAVIVYDHFHVIKLFNDGLSGLRRDVQREAAEQLQKKVLKGTRWLLLKNPENLDESRNERARLDEALRLNKPLATAYYLKEDLRQFWAQPDKAAAAAFLADWIARAEASGVRMLQKFAKTLAAHRAGLLAYYDYPISTARLEGTNTKIKLLQRQAYGFRDREFFKLKIKGIHETKYALVG